MTERERRCRAKARSALWIAFAVIAAAALVRPSHQGLAFSPEQCRWEAGPQVRPQRALDGQTIGLADGGELRLINILPATDAARLDATVAALNELLQQGGEARLHFAGRRRDRRGRWLGHLVIARPEATIWVQAWLVEQGLARVYSLPETASCVRRLQMSEAAARAQARGLWADPAMAVIPAARTRTLLARRAGFAIVEGRVRTTATRRAWTFVNFGDDWRGDFTVAVAAGDRRRFDGSPVRLDALTGAVVRVRGWIERWNGPVIKATHPEQFEILSAADCPSC